MGSGQQQIFHDPIPLGDGIAYPMETVLDLSNAILKSILDELSQSHTKPGGFHLASR